MIMTSKKEPSFGPPPPITVNDGTGSPDEINRGQAKSGQAKNMMMLLLCF